MYRLRSLSLILSLLLLVFATPVWAEEDVAANAAVEARLLESARYLASDELEGRGVGTKGLDLAAEYIARQFKAIGLKTDLWDGGPFQKFMFPVGAELGAKNELALVGPAAEGASPRRLPLKLGAEFTPLALGGSGTFDLPLVFAGYGITSKDDNYDDYAGIDVKGKAVIVLRRGPQQANPHSRLGSSRSPHSPLTRKLSNAFEHGAAAVIFVTDDYDLQRVANEQRKAWQQAVDDLVAADAEFKKIEKPTREQTDAHRRKVDDLAAQIREASEKMAAQNDPLVEFNAGGFDRSGRTIPVVHMRRSAIDMVLKAALETDLATLERQIDLGPKPHSQDVPGWKIAGELTVNRKEVEVKNVGGVLEGEGELANETIVIGAHYDHVGFGGPGSGSLDPSSRDVHNGADDNGSGTSALIEVARQLAQRAPEKKNRRRILFMAFTAEERGLIGSAQYTRTPLYKLEDTAAMVNLDMVGRLNDNKLIIEGSGTASEFNGLIDRFNESYGFAITKKATGYGPSDHASFYAKKIPVIFFFTGTHRDYHRPSDDYDKLNLAGMRRITAMASDMSLYLAESSSRPTYQEVAMPRGQAGGGGDRPWFGSIPDFAQDQPGYVLTGVTKDSPAEKAGIKGGDIIVKLGESQIGNLEDFDSALRKYKPGDKVPVVLKRAGKEVTVEVTLGKAPN